MNLNCTFKITINDKVVEFENEKQLNSFLKENFEILSQGKNITDLEFSKMEEGVLSEQDRTLTLLKNVRERGPKIETVILEDGSTEAKASSYKGVTSFLEEISKNGVDNIIPYFSKDNYRINKTSEILESLKIGTSNSSLQDIYNKLKSDLSSGNITEDQFNNKIREAILPLILKDEENWNKLPEMGNNIHKVSELYFKNRLEGRETTIEELSLKFTFTSAENLVNYINYLDKLVEKIESVNGKCVIIPEYKFWDNKNKLVGVADILAVDEKGKVHIYDFKTSYKDPNSWTSAKTLKHSYQLGFYRNMLENKGFKVDSVHLIPLQFENIDFENSSFSGIKNYDLINVNVNLKSNQLAIIDSFIPIDKSVNFKSSGTSESVKKVLLDAFGYNVNIRSIKSNIDEFKKTIQPDKNKPETHLYFFDETTGKGVSFKKEEIDEKIADYFKRLSEDTTFKIRSFKNHLSKSIEGRIELGNYSNKSSRNDSIVRVFSKYVLGDWQLIEDDETLDELGLIGFVNKKTNTLDLVSYTANELDAKVKLNLGSSILGNYMSDNISKRDVKLFEATNSNIEMLKAYIYVNENSKSLEGLNLGEVTVFNETRLKFTSNYSHRIRYNANALFAKMGIQNNIKNIENADYYQLLISRLSNIIESKQFLSPKEEKVMIGFKDKLIDLQDENRLKALLDIQKSLIDEFSASGATDTITFNNEQQKILGIVSEAIAYEKGLPLVVEEDMAKFSFNSLYFSNPNTNPSENDRFIVSEVKNAMNKIGLRQLEFKQESRKPIENLFKSKNFGVFKEYVIGTNIEAYKNLFEVDGNGKIHPSLTVKNPYTNTSLSQEEKEFLKFFLQSINKIRFGNGDPYSDIGRQKIESGEWFQIPLLRASSMTKLKNKGYKDALKEYWDGLLNVNNLFKEDDSLEKRAKDMYSMFNGFDYSKDQESRSKLLQREGSDSFETDLEAVLDMFVYSSIRKEEYDEVLPICNAIRTAMAFKAYNLGIPVENNVDFAKKYQKSAIYNEPDITPEVKKYYRFISFFKSIVSYANLGLSPMVGIAAFSQGQLANLTRIGSKFYGENMFDSKDYLWAEAYMMKDCTKSIKDLTKVEELNMMYRLNNMDINRLPERMANNKRGVTNFKSNWMFWTASAPDYFNRMTIFIAQMKKDGAWDAHEIKNGKLIYDWKKDKRFEVFANKKESDPNYNKQKALYTAMLNDFKEEGHEGTDLPRAYTLKQRESLKMISDQIHGYYDHESKILVNNTILGSLLLQFKQFMTARKEKWTMLPGEYAIGDYTQLEENGEKYWLKDGELTTENTGEPAMIFKGKYMEGIWYSLKGIAKDFHESHYSVGELFKAVKDHPERAANVRLLAWDMGIVLVLAIAFGMIDWKELKKDDAYTYSIYRAILRSGQDLNVFNNIGTIVSGESPFSSISYFSDLYKSAVGIVSGDKNLGTEIFRNVGTLRMFEPLVSETK